MISDTTLDVAEMGEFREWQQHDRTAASVRKDIGYFKDRRQYFEQQLADFHDLTKNYKGGSREWADQQCEKRKNDLLWYDRRVEFLEWLLQQPRLPD